MSLGAGSQKGLDVLQRYHTLLGTKWTSKISEKQTYLLTSDIIEWLKKKEPDERISNCDLLLDQVYSTEMTQKSSEDIVDCMKLFCVLLEINCGNLVHIFKRAGVNDENLRRPSRDAVEHVLRGRPHHDAAKLVDEFEERKWRYFPVVFKYNDDQIYRKGTLFPFCRFERINHKGATARLFQASVKEELVDSSLKRVIRTSRYEDKDYGFCYRFVVKSFNADNRDTFEAERDAFAGIHGETRVIRYLGQYQEEFQQNQWTYNILLEYGEFDLDEYFYDHYPPVLGAEIVDFWKELFEVAVAVRGLHNLEQINNAGRTTSYDGWHSDIKPDNILRVDDRWKLADFGFARFEKHGHGKQPMTRLAGGTATYGAPECHQLSLNPDILGSVSQTIDTWSLGCVFSVAATWVILGSQGMKQFQDVRRAAICDLKKKDRIDSDPDKSVADDAFHDGSNPLLDVKYWHDCLRQVIRSSDTTSALVLDLIDKKMLLADPKDRLVASEICDELKLLLCKARKRTDALDESNPIENSILNSMINFDNNAPVTKEQRQARQNDIAASRRLQDDGSKQATKSGLLKNIIPGKVANRGGALGAAMGRRYGKPAISLPSPGPPQMASDEIPFVPRFLSNKSTSSNQPTYSLDTGFTTSSSNGLSFSDDSLESLTTQSLASAPLKMDESMPIYQEWLSLQKKTKSILPQIFTRRKIDDYLSRFVSDRDLIFVVDNGKTMSPLWNEVTITLQVLAAKVEGLDNDGIDLIFTFNDRNNVRNSKRNASYVFRDAMNRAKAPQDDSKPYGTDMARTLGEIFQQYLKRPSKKMTLLILTDGVWEGSPDPNEVENKIATFLKSPVIESTFRDRAFSIQFISFGQSGISRLEALDDDMTKKYHITDVIDHEPYSGDVYKMILGSFEKSFDVKKTPTLPVPGSSPTAGENMSRSPSQNSRRPSQYRQNTTETGNRRRSIFRS
ncbi:uncharacterized protein BCR38DRAFT_81607 [Pseudomassariella vexata]|uniref:Protein kinase domain-containing protein n=1 Tax=Pseudomassariella vexata TaxID=1141098 RepID=A0A1Y2DF97_9PEZI|nr:uncharacterized protein BCR38DRAFT_81607 [Pseudomassariella vexata]ORY57867.1 hypothetical protein BCR38DRAFT_81607 [Pseudomassariella vexata]